jgi:hypothetical protein
MRRLRGLSRDGLRLRAWALRVLAGAPDEAPPAVDEQAWSLFLRVEACALPLQRAGAFPESRDASATGEQAATVALKRVLSARAQLWQLDGLVSDLPDPVVVLKGGVTVGGEEPLDVLDVDVLTSPEHGAALAARLDALGHAAGADPPPGVRAHHLAPRMALESVPVEVHFALPQLGDEAGVLRRSVPLAGYATLRRPAPADQLRLVLAHMAAHHPERRGRLRDLLLATQALRECSPVELESVRLWSRTAPFAGEVASVLGMAEALARGRVPADPYRHVAAGAYLMIGAHAAGRGTPWPREKQRALNVLLGGAEDRRAFLELLVQPTARPSGLSVLAALERHASGVGAGVRHAVRAGRYLVALARAAPMAWAARGLAGGSEEARS